jgi:hypothetical protein
LGHYFPRPIDDQRKRDARHPDSLLEIGFELVGDFAQRNTNALRHSENVFAPTTFF